MKRLFFQAPHLQTLFACLAVALATALHACLDPSGLDPEVLDTWVHIKSKDGLAGDNVTAIFEDDRGGIWIGTTSGVSLYSQGRFTSYRQSNGLSSNYITAIAQDNKGRLWVATDKGVNVNINNSWVIPSLFEDVLVTVLEETSDNRLMIGTACCGAFEFRTDVDNFYYFYNPNNCASCNYINTIFQDGDGRIWLGTDDGAKRFHRNNEIVSIRKSDGLPGSYVTAISEDEWGNFWVGTFDGYTIARLSETQITQIGLANLQEQNWIRSLVVDHMGVLWVATGTNGLYRYDGAYMRKVTVGFNEDRIGTLLRDKIGRIWVGTNNGLYCYTPPVIR